MSKHGQVQKDIKGLIDQPEEMRKLGTENKLMMFRSIVHAADICNSARPFEMAKFWAESLFCEFFGQGDQEKALGLEISMMCDRQKYNFAQSQIGFLSFVTLPYFSALAGVIPKMKEQ